MGRLPRQSYLRAPLIAQLFYQLPVDMSAQLARVSSRTVYRATEHFGISHLGGLAACVPPHRASDNHRVPALLTGLIERWVQDRCPPQSGSIVPRFVQWVSSKKLYSQFRADWASLLFDVLLRVQSGVSGEADDSALHTMMEKLRPNAYGLGFVAFLLKTPQVASSFGGLTAQGPAQLVVDYLVDPSSSPVPTPLSRAAFDGLKHNLPLSRPRKHSGQFDCPICFRSKSDDRELERLKSLAPPLDAHDSDKLKLFKRRVDKNRMHKLALASQTQTFHVLRQNVPTGAVFMVGDFSTYDLEPNVNDKNKRPLSTFVLVMERPGCRRKYFDFLCEDWNTQTRDTLFVRAVFLYLLPLLVAVLLIILGTDTCAGQFRSRFALALFGALKAWSGKAFRLLLHAEHHGHDLADAHVTHGRAAIRDYLLESQGERVHEERSNQAATSSLSPLKTATDLQRVLTNYFRTGKHEIEYECVVLPTVDRRPGLKPDARPIPGIMAYHDFTFESATTVSTKQLSTDTSADTLNIRFNKEWNVLTGASLWPCFLTDWCSLHCLPGSAMGEDEGERGAESDDSESEGISASERVCVLVPVVIFRRC